jgi:uncharacterized protein YcgI (DUF1989 family)
MIQPEGGSLPPEADAVVPGGWASMVRVARGQLLSIETPEGGQVAALFAWTAADRDEWLSPHHTRVFGGTFELRMGTRMVTNRRRPMFVVGRDSVRRHDLLLPASAETVDEVRSALGGAGVVAPRVPDPVNLFLDSRLGPDGGIEVRACPARPGDRWTARVLIDADVVIAAGQPGIRAASADPPRALRVRVVNLVEDLPGDLPILAR